MTYDTHSYRGLGKVPDCCTRPLGLRLGVALDRAAAAGGCGPLGLFLVALKYKNIVCFD